MKSDVIIFIIDHFYIVLVTALVQAHCTLVTCDSESVTVAFYHAFGISTKVVCLQRCLVITWLVPHETAAVSAHIFIHHTTTHHVTSLCAKPHAHCVCVFSCDLPPALRAFEVHLRMYLWWTTCTLYLHACQVRVTIGDSGLCCCTCVLYFKH